MIQGLGPTRFQARSSYGVGLAQLRLWAHNGVALAASMCMEVMERCGQNTSSLGFKSFSYLSCCQVLRPITYWWLVGN